MSRKYHPDKNKNDNEDAKNHYLKIQEAYEVLSDSEKRGKYDLSLKTGFDFPFSTTPVEKITREILSLSLEDIYTGCSDKKFTYKHRYYDENKTIHYKEKTLNIKMKKGLPYPEIFRI